MEEYNTPDGWEYVGETSQGAYVFEPLGADYGGMQLTVRETRADTYYVFLTFREVIVDEDEHDTLVDANKHARTLMEKQPP